MNAPARTFEARPAVRGDDPLLIGMVGPPGGGKTKSALRLGKGMQAVRGGDMVVIDTEGGRARRYSDEFRFLHVMFDPPHEPHAFLEAIEQQVARKPACIIVDSMSDEHEGIGGYLEWHDAMVPKMSGNEWAAWAKPKASRKRLITGILHIRVPLIFTFRAREKTKQAKDDKGKNIVVNIGWMPIAPLEIVHTLDLTCILPPRANGVPVWESSKVGEDFIIKLPSFLAPLIKEGPLSEETGRALAQWAKGGTASAHAGPAPAPSASQPDPPGAEGATDLGGALSVEDMGRQAAMRGKDVLTAFAKSRSAADKAKLRAIWPELEGLFPT